MNELNFYAVYIDHVKVFVSSDVFQIMTYINLCQSFFPPYKKIKVKKYVSSLYCGECFDI